MKDFFADSDIRNANVRHSWVVRIMDLPTRQQRCNACDILGSWITDEMNNLFGCFKVADRVVMATCVYMLEYEAIRVVDPEECNPHYPLLKDAASAVYFYQFAKGGLDDGDCEKARIFLQLMKDGYMKPDVDKLLKLAETYVPGDRADVSLRG